MQELGELAASDIPSAKFICMTDHPEGIDLTDSLYISWASSKAFLDMRKDSCVRRALSWAPSSSNSNTARRTRFYMSQNMQYQYFFIDEDITTYSSKFFFRSPRFVGTTQSKFLCNKISTVTVSLQEITDVIRTSKISEITKTSLAAECCISALLR